MRFTRNFYVAQTGLFFHRPLEEIYMNKRGYYGEFGGAFIPEILVATFDDLVSHFNDIKNDPGFWESYVDLMSTYSCRATPLTYARESY